MGRINPNRPRCPKCESTFGYFLRDGQYFCRSCGTKSDRTVVYQVMERMAKFDAEQIVKESINNILNEEEESKEKKEIDEKKDIEEDVKDGDIDGKS